MSYTIDVYRDDAKVQRSLVNFGTFVTLFPQLIAGPILKYKDLGDQIDQRDCTAEKFASGVQIFMVGMGKKVLLANNVGLLWERYKALPLDQLTVAGAWLGVIAFTFQITSTSPAIPIWPPALAGCWALSLPPTSAIPISPAASPSSGGGGTSPCPPGSGSISTSPWGQPVQQAPVDAEPVPGLGAPHLHGASWNYLLWGLYFFALLMLEKLFLLPRLEQAPRVLQHSLHHVSGGGQLGHLRHRGLFPAAAIWR